MTAVMPVVSDPPEPTQQSTDARSSSDDDAGAPKMKVLTAEDSAPMRLLLKAQLSAWGLDVIAAEDGAEAWQLFQEHEMPLVVTDWIMPNMDGLELIRKIRDHPLDHYVYVILLTAKSDKEDLIQAMDAGADDFLVKPCDNQELRVRLREGTRILKLEQTLAEKNLEIRNAQAALVQSEKLASLGQLAAGMAHEINNPIAYVNNNLSVLRRDVAGLLEILDAYRRQHDALKNLDPAAAEEISRLQREHDLSWILENTDRTFDSSIEGLRRVRDIVRNLREFARLDEADYDTMLMGDAIRSTLSIVQHKVDEKELLVSLDDAGNPSIQCRPITINQMLHNVLINAVQACDRGDRIEIEISEEPQQVVIEITDSGAGIAPKDLEKVFEPFFTTRPVGEGKGLGLSLCYGVVRDHGGRIDISSRLGEGTTVRIQLPKESRFEKETGSEH